ncbi:MAG: GNAT family N-acetyltransferase [Pyrinomonadaceae bacterium]|nr:GNAT family N-acetyltransferase [Pyrinomonadaceae bacterium]
MSGIASKVSKKILETERLILREFDLDDAEFILELLNSPGWLKYIGNKKVKTINDAKSYLSEGPVKSYAENGFGLSMVELKFIGVPIGMCGLVNRDTLDDIDIGFAMLPDFAATGYGSEIALATLEYGRDQLGLKRIVGITVKDNKASIALLEKIGLKFEKMIDIPEDNEKLMLFGVNFDG